ncbi:MAG TPA: hypothetical protein VFA68_17900 [Terriglobales bacterium]|nr:hypothetical protein [Terriglobales bacterium]
MLLFRSELHVDRWCKQWHRPRGGMMSLATCWRLAKQWYADRLDPDWKPKTAAEAQDAFTDLGLTGDFWRLA